MTVVITKRNTEISVKTIKHIYGRSLTLRMISLFCVISKTSGYSQCIEQLTSNFFGENLTGSQIL